VYIMKACGGYGGKSPSIYSMDGGRILGFHCPFPKEKPYCPQFVADETKKPCCPQFVAVEARTRASNGR